MRCRALLVLFTACACLFAATPPKARVVRQKAKRTTTVSWSADEVNNPATKAEVGPKSQGAATLRSQILLNRAHYSVGEIDGLFGDNMTAVINAYQQDHNLPVTGKVDSATWDALNSDTAPALNAYTVTEDDVNYKFTQIPPEMKDQAALPALNYQNVAEMLGERFHCSPKLLERLNPEKNVEMPGTQLTVPNVADQGTMPKAAQVRVQKSTKLVTALDDNGKTIAVYPATMGSEHDPLPIGDWRIVDVMHNPPFYYNPALFWDAKPGDTKMKLPPGPNGPVGVVWMGLSKEHYGIHGTPEPSTIGHTESHGCIRLTNWDAAQLSTMVKVGTPAHLVE